MPTIALLPWGDVVEDFLDPLGVGLDEFRDEMAGGWLFGYVEALGRAGVEVAVVVVSRAVGEVRRWRHGPTGAPLVVLPAARAHRAVRRVLARPTPPPGAAFLRAAAPYLATPPRALAAELRRLDADAVLCQEYEDERFELCLGVGRALGIPVWATFQGGSVGREGLRHVVRRRAVRAAAGLVIGPGAEADRVRDRYGVAGAGVARIPNPLDLGRWGTDGVRAERRSELGLPDEAVVVAWHGRVVRHTKGVDVLLAAWEELRQRGQDGERRLLLVGTGDDAEEIAALIRRYGFDDVVRIDRYVLDKGEVAAYLAAADVYAFPSRHEGFPVAPVEAAACGLPVVSTDAPGIAEIFPGGEASGAIVVPRDDPGALAGALAGLLGDPLRRSELGARARQRTVDAFGLDAVGAQLRSALLGGASRHE